MRAKIESHLEYIYVTEQHPELPDTFHPKNTFKPNAKAWTGCCIPYTPGFAFDVRNLGNELEIEPILNPDGTLDFNIASHRVEHIADRLVSDPKVTPIIQPTFRVESTQTNFTTKSGEDFLLNLLTPKNNSKNRIFLIARAQILDPVRKPQRRDIQFNDLPAAATLEIDHFSNGCFHNTGTRFSIEGNTVTVSQLIPKEKRLGTIELSDAGLQKLDKTLAYYREYDGKGSCTTREAISLKLQRDGEEIAFEKYLDGTCSIHDQEGLLTFDQLAARPLQKY